MPKYVLKKLTAIRRILKINFFVLQQNTVNYWCFNFCDWSGAIGITMYAKMQLLMVTCTSYNGLERMSVRGVNVHVQAQH